MSDHPRVCGEKCNPGFKGQGGSRITPACAGKRPSLAPVPGACGDHPRVCGEKAYSLVINGSEWGSPPRVRGKASGWPAVRSKPRITPACAGKRYRSKRAQLKRRDHPRVCGEKHSAFSSSVQVPGSPPRVRGKAFSSSIGSNAPGITPACAGKRACLTSLMLISADHPRVCGEKVLPVSWHLPVPGSPPRVRGKEIRNHFNAPCTRITPACAGKRLKRSHSIGHFSCILCLFHSVLHRASVSGGSRAGPCAPPCLPAQNAVPV